MTRSKTTGIIVSILFLDVQCYVFHYSNKNMLFVANVHEASFVLDYAISFDILVCLTQFVLFLIAFSHQYLDGISNKTF
jgi:hypothetical protein